MTNLIPLRFGTRSVFGRKCLNLKRKILISASTVRKDLALVSPLVVIPLKHIQASLKNIKSKQRGDKREAMIGLSFSSPRRFILACVHTHQTHRHMKPSNGRGSAWHCTKKCKYKMGQKTNNCLILSSKRKSLIKAEFASLNKKFGSFFKCHTISKNKNWDSNGSRSSIDLKR